jgi:hypothetical protein
VDEGLRLGRCPKIVCFHRKVWSSLTQCLALPGLHVMINLAVRLYVNTNFVDQCLILVYQLTDETCILLKCKNSPEDPCLYFSIMSYHLLQSGGNNVLIIRTVSVI